MKTKTFLIVYLSLITLNVFLRIIVVSKNSSYFFIDEFRYLKGHHFLSNAKDSIFDGINYFFSDVSHIFFTIITCIVELLRYTFVKLFVNYSIEPYMLNLSDDGLIFSGIIISLFSVLNLIIFSYFMYICKACYLQILFFVIFYTISIANFYHSCHFFPCDTAISFFLISIVLIRKCKTKLFFLGAFFAGLCSLTYYGYWVLTLISFMYYILIFKFNNYSFLKNIFVFIFTILSPFIFLYYISLFSDYNFYDSLISFLKLAKENQQGDYGRGFIVIFEYLYSCDKFIFIFFICTFFISFFIKKNISIPHYVLFSNFSIIFLFLFFVFTSDIIKSNVLYGRTIKIIVPFLCMTSAFYFLKILDQINFKYKSSLLCTILILLLSNAAYNFYGILKITYPKSIDYSTQVNSPLVSVSSFIGKNLTNDTLSEDSNESFCINNQRIISPIISLNKLPNYSIIEEYYHPLSFKPYQFEALTNNERKLLDQNELKIILAKFL